MLLLNTIVCRPCHTYDLYSDGFSHQLSSSYPQNPDNVDELITKSCVTTENSKKMQQPGYMRLIIITHYFCKFGISRFRMQVSYRHQPEEDLYPFLASDGLTLALVPQSSFAKCYSWNHNSFILSTLTITCIFTGLSTHPTRLFAC